MTRSPDSPIPSAGGQLPVEKRDDEASECRQGGEENPRAATQVNAVAASSTPPASRPTQLDLFPGRAGPLAAKPVMDGSLASNAPVRRDGVQGGGTRRQRTKGKTRSSFLLSGLNQPQLPVRSGAYILLETNWALTRRGKILLAPFHSECSGYLVLGFQFLFIGVVA